MVFEFVSPYVMDAREYSYSWNRELPMRGLVWKVEINRCKQPQVDWFLAMALHTLYRLL